MIKHNLKKNYDQLYGKNPDNMDKMYIHTVFPKATAKKITQKKKNENEELKLYTKHLFNTKEGIKGETVEHFLR